MIQYRSDLLRNFRHATLSYIHQHTPVDSDISYLEVVHLVSMVRGKILQHGRTTLFWLLQDELVQVFGCVTAGSGSLTGERDFRPGRYITGGAHG